jgi:hypothetical protein
VWPVREIAVDSLKESAVFGALGLPVAYVLLYFVATSFLDLLGFVLLVEACGLWLVGGAMELTTTASVRKIMSLVGGKYGKLDATDEKRAVSGAAVFTLTGVVLFFASLIIAFAVSG